MKLPNLHIKGSSITQTLKQNISIALWAFLLLIALLVGYVIFQEIGKISQVRTDNSGITGQIVRVNLSEYDQLEKWLDENERFLPQTIPRAEVFSTAPPPAVAP